MRSAIASPRSRSYALTVLAVLAVLYTLYFAREVLRPIVFAVLLSFLLGPVVRWLARRRVPTALGAALVVFALLGALGVAGYELAAPVQRWAAHAPETLATARERLGAVVRPMERFSSTAERVEQAAAPAAGPAPRDVVVRGPSLLSRAYGTTQRLAASLLEVLLLLYFLLAGGDLFLQKLVKVLPRLPDKQKAVEMARAMEASISTYLLTTAAVNLAEGAAVAAAMWLLGMPNPLLWGVLVVFLEFIPYMGATLMFGVLGVAALTRFDSLGHAMLVPVSFLVINLVQANLITPMVLGHRLELNPVVIFVGLAFFYSIWGIAGAFLAVPLLAVFKIVCDRVGALAAVGEFLAGRDDQERRIVIREPQADPPAR
jgi:predicted PurR-regulated permease PerM